MTADVQNEDPLKPQFTNHWHNPTQFVYSPTLRRIASLYLGTFGAVLVTGMCCVVVGPLLSFTGRQFDGAGSFLVRCVQLHAGIMTYLCLIPGIPAALGNYALERLCENVRVEVGNARASLAAYWIGTIVLVVSIALGGIDGGISYFAAFSRRGPTPCLGVAAGVFIVGLSCVLNGLHALKIVTSQPRGFFGRHSTHDFAFMLCLSGIVHLVLLPVQGLTLSMMILERLGVHAFFDPTHGGNPLLLRQLSWFYLQPLMMAAVLPAIGLFGNVGLNNRPGHHLGTYHLAVAYVTVGVFTWAIHLSAQGTSTYLSALASVLSLVAFTLLQTMMFLNLPAASATDATRSGRGSTTLTWGAFLTLEAGILAGLPLCMPGVAAGLQSTLYLVGHSHFIGLSSSVLCVLLGLSLYHPAARPTKWLSSLATAATFVTGVGACIVFVSQLISGIGEFNEAGTASALSKHSNLYASLGVVGLVLGLVTIVAVVAQSVRVTNERK